jgi:hypothetical protein
MSNLARQPFFQERVVSILKERNRDALESMFKIQRFSNPMTLVELAGDPKKPVVDTRTVRARTFSTGPLEKKKSRLPIPWRKAGPRRKFKAGCAPLCFMPSEQRLLDSLGTTSMLGELAGKTRHISKDITAAQNATVLVRRCRKTLALASTLRILPW